MSQIRVNYPTEVEAAINKIVNMKFTTAYTFTSMACFFDRDDIAFVGFSKLFRFLSKLVNKSAKKLMCFQTMRGGRVVFGDVKKPERDEWGTPVEALTTTMNMCKTTMQTLQELVKTATTGHDTLTVTHITEEHLTHMIEFIKELSEHLTCLKKMPTGTEYMYDKTIEREVTSWMMREHMTETMHFRRMTGTMMTPTTTTTCPMTKMTTTMTDKTCH